MRAWIDCEFNEFKGELISMAIVCEDGREFYEVLPCDKPGKWVAEHVMPILFKQPISLTEFQQRLANFFTPYDSIHLIADWPEDISHFCNALIVGPGFRLNTPYLTMEIKRELNAENAQIPHNALSDARALRMNHLNLEVMKGKK